MEKWCRHTCWDLARLARQGIPADAVQQIVRGALVVRREWKRVECCDEEVICSRKRETFCRTEATAGRETGAKRTGPRTRREPQGREVVAGRQAGRRRSEPWGAPLEYLRIRSSSSSSSSTTTTTATVHPSPVTASQSRSALSIHPSTHPSPSVVCAQVFARAAGIVSSPDLLRLGTDPSDQPHDDATIAPRRRPCPIHRILSAFRADSTHQPARTLRFTRSAFAARRSAVTSCREPPMLPL